MRFDELFAVIAWQTKILLDVEPDVRRRLVSVALGSRTREWVAGLLAGAWAHLLLVYAWLRRNRA